MGPQGFTFIITKFVGDKLFGDSRCKCYSKTKNFGIYVKSICLANK